MTLAPPVLFTKFGYNVNVDNGDYDMINHCCFLRRSKKENNNRKHNNNCDHVQLIKLLRISKEKLL